MPFQSEKQRRYMHANLPEIAQRWERDYAGGGITRLGYQYGNTVAPFPPQYMENNILENAAKMKPDALNIMMQGFQGGADPQGGFEEFDPYGNIQMGLENPDKDPYQSPQGLAFLKNKMGNMWSGAQDFTGNLMSGASNMFKGVKNKGGQLAGSLMGMLSGIPGLGMLMGSIRPDDPYERFQKQMFAEQGGGGDPNKDPWGKNIRSMVGGYDVMDQLSELAQTGIGKKYGYEAALADDELSEEELAAMQNLGGKGQGLKGWQLNRLKGLAAASQKAKAWKAQQDLKLKQEREFDRPASLQSQVTSQANREARERVSRKEPKDYGKTETRASSGWKTGSPFVKGGLASLWQR